MIAFVIGNAAFEVNGNLAPSALAVVPATGGTPVVLTDTSGLNTSPVWIPGRHSLFFISDRDGGRDIYEQQLSSSGRPVGLPTRVTAGLNPDRIAVSADGSRLAWSVFGETANVWSLPIPSRDSLPLSQASPVTSGAQTIENEAAMADGRWLYYDSDLKGNSDIWRIPLANGVPAGPAEQVTTDPAPEFSPGVSADGKEVAFHSFRTGNRDVFVISSSGGTAVQVTKSPEHDYNPRWSPDGKTLTFEASRSDSALWTVRRRSDGTWDEPKLLLAKGSAVYTGWSPDGRSVLFSGDSGVRVIDLATGRDRLVAPTATEAVWPAWSADGAAIYWAATENGRFAIHSVPSQGGTSRTLAYADAPERQLHRIGFAASSDRFYFTLSNRTADVWVAEVARK